MYISFILPWVRIRSFLICYNVWMETLCKIQTTYWISEYIKIERDVEKKFSKVEAALFNVLGILHLSMLLEHCIFCFNPGSNIVCIIKSGCEKQKYRKLVTQHYTQTKIYVLNFECVNYCAVGPYLRDNGSVKCWWWWLIHIKPKPFLILVQQSQ